jgi:hypothetical protein
MKLRSQMKRFWMTVSWVCFTVGAVLLYRRDMDWAFIAGVIGSLAWFLRYRVQMKELVSEAGEQSEQDGKAQSNEE